VDGSDTPAGAAVQAGAFSRDQAIRHGLTPRQIRYRLDTGRWHRIVGSAMSADERPACGWPAATLAHAAQLTWPDAVVGVGVAGVLHGFPIAPVDRTGAVHVYVEVKHDPRPGLVAHRRPLPPGQIMSRPDGLRITTATRTALDCLAALPPDDAGDLFAWLSAHQVLDRRLLAAAIQHGTGRFGVSTLRHVHRLTRTGAVSEAERRVHDLLLRAGIHGWIAGVQVSDQHGVIGVVDLLFPVERIVIEIDGRRAHSDPAAFERDRIRQNRLIRAGYVVLRYTWARLVNEPTAVVTEIRQVVTQRRRSLE
jgi:very-short-patch-repair endonuclease